MTAIKGNTYPFRAELKALGGKWDAEQKAWLVPDSAAEKAKQLVASAPKEAGKKEWRGPTQCKQCGAEASRWNKVYRNGICRQCYRDEQEEADMGY